MAEIVVVGSSNVDLKICTQRLPGHGETVAGHSYKREWGGKGANQAVAAALLHEEPRRVAMIGALGSDDFAKRYLEYFATAGVVTSCMKQLPDEETGVAIVTLAEDGENTIVLSPEANGACRPAMLDESCAAMLRQAKVVMVQNEIPLETTRKALELAREGGAVTLLTAAPVTGLNRELFGLVDCVLCNATEINQIANLFGDQAGAPAAAAESVMRRNAKMRAVIVTLGADGCLVCERGGWRTVIPGFKIEHVVDTVGAGDCFAGTIGYFVSKGSDFADAAKAGARVAAASVTKHGASESYPRRAELEADVFAKLPGDAGKVQPVAVEKPATAAGG